MAVNIRVIGASQRPKQAAGTLVIGTKRRLLEDDVRALLPAGVAGVWEAMVGRVVPGDNGAGTCTWVEGKTAHQVSVGALPSACSRHNCTARPHAVSNVVRGHAPRKGVLEIIAAMERPEDALATACAVARAYPEFSLKSAKAGAKKPKARQVRLLLVGPDGAVAKPAQRKRAQLALDGVRFASALVDAPTSEVDTDALLAAAREVAEETGAEIHVVRGANLHKKGFGGLWGVGKAAVAPPALVTLSLGGKPLPRDRKLSGSGAKKGAASKLGEAVVWVGKGIVYDTGGLSLKTKSGMPGMKGDMAGAAAVLGAFRAAARGGWDSKKRGPLHAVLCLAENAVGPTSFRPDDVIKLYSGKTVEVNNTDAEGRLVLADGVAYAVRHLKPSRIIDLATLTGAQLVSTGRRHAGIVCNDADLEAKTVAVGQACGDLVHPLPYCPEFFRGEFKSQVADLKNSVKDRANGQSSCAGQFVAEHLGDFDGEWLHIDLAGPATTPEDRGTGYGVALLVELL